MVMMLQKTGNEENGMYLSSFFFIRGDFGSNVTPLDVDIYDRLKFS